MISTLMSISDEDFMKQLDGASTALTFQNLSKISVLCLFQTPHHLLHFLRSVEAPERIPLT